MGRQDRESIPSREALQDWVADRLEHFDVDLPVHLGPDGTWREGLRSAWQRASNELWFRLWRISGTPAFEMQCINLLLPFTRDRSVWNSTLSVFAHKYGRKVPRPGILAPATVLTSMIEIKSNRINARTHVAEWDYRGKALRDWFGRRGDIAVDEFRAVLGAGAEQYIDEVMAGLESNSRNLFSRVADIIAREEWLSETLGILLENMQNPEKSAAAGESIREHIAHAAALRSGFPEAYIRPCMDLVSNPHVDLNSGIPYEAVSLLGRFPDRRAAGALVEALRRIPLEYVLLRANIVFALGRIRHPDMLGPMRAVLRGPRAVRVGAKGGSPGYLQALDPEKREAVWALGGCPEISETALSDLAHVTALRDMKTLAYLAFGFRRIGMKQRDRDGHVDSVVLRVLSGLLGSEHIEVFEEAAAALTDFGYRDALDMMYFKDFVTVPILALKPSSTGLYELSEALLHMVSVKRPVVIAVTGDSGTGKTYFCETIAAGFADIGPEEILYLMRDRRGDRTFDRILGLDWLRRHVDSEFYDNYDIPEHEDDPQIFFERFMARHKSKKVIILDGWRDSAYFHQVIKTFYANGYLDIIVRFKTSLSTRRSNLEEREGTLDSVESHLPLIESPSIENTMFYREGTILVYNLDNSMPSRLSRPEILEVFGKKKVPNWAERIHLGRFSEDQVQLTLEGESLSVRRFNIDCRRAALPACRHTRVAVVDSSFSRELNPDLEHEPRLLEVVRPEKVDAAGIAFYTHGQLAFRGRDGEVGVMVGFEDRVYSAETHTREASGLAVVGADLVSFDGDGLVAITSLKDGSATNFTVTDSPVSAISHASDGCFITGHADGSLAFWDILSGEIRVAKVHTGAICNLARDRYGRVASAGPDGSICIVDFSRLDAVLLEGIDRQVSCLSAYPDGRFVVGTSPDSDNERGEGPCIDLKLVNIESGEAEVVRIPGGNPVISLHTYFDGRIILGLMREGDGAAGTLIVAEPGSPSPGFWLLAGHERETRACITMGPRIVTSGIDGDDSTIRIWGAESYVLSEHDKLALLEGAGTRPPYHRSLF